MKNFFEKLRRRVSISYGQDALNRLILIISLALMILNLFLGFFPLWLTAMVLYLLYFFRFFSKNYAARQRELAFYNRLIAKLKQKTALMRRKWSERDTHKYFKCRRCSAQLRVPKGKGKITVTCPKCGEKMNKKT